MNDLNKFIYIFLKYFCNIINKYYLINYDLNK